MPIRARVLEFKPRESQPFLPKNSEEKRGVSDRDLTRAILKSFRVEVDVVTKIKLHLGNLKGHISRQSIAIRRDGLKQYDLPSLIEIAEKSNPDNWTSKATYYTALIQEIESRGWKPSIKVTG